MEIQGVIGAKKRGKEKEKDTAREGSKGTCLSWGWPALWLVWKRRWWIKWSRAHVTSFGKLQVLPSGARGKEPDCQCRRLRDVGSVPGLGRSPGGGHGNPLQYSCLENPMDRGAWRATVHGVTKSRTWLSDLASVNQMLKVNKNGYFHIIILTQWWTWTSFWRH